MAEEIAISLSGKFAGALSHTAVLALSSLVGIRSDIATTMHHLEFLRALLRVVDSHHGTDKLSATWVSQVREVAFELEDVADECSFLSGRRFVRDCANVKAWFALSRRLRKARERLSQVLADKERYGIRLPDGATPTSGVAAAVQLAASTHFLEEEEIVGFAAHRKQLMGWLAEDAEPRRTLVALCGMGGVGKTTLVTSVYKEVATSHFYYAAWVAVSQGFSMDDLLRKISKELHLDVTGCTDYLSLVAALREHLGGKRYLVVLDDVWDASLWDKLRRAVFHDDATGSRVVITTRSNDVARAAAAERIMMLEPLPWREAWTLFCSVAFRQEFGQTCPSHLEELAINLVKRCGGLPLAIVSVGNLLALKDRTEFAWRNVRDSLVWDNSRSDLGHLGIGEAASILNLSIDDLPENLKKCFLSCSIYPEDFLIKRKILIRNWVAQGFVDETQGERTMEDVADEYLDHLVQRSLMLVVARNEFGRAKRCVIHDLIRELITHRSRAEGFIQFAKCNVTLNSDIQIRHLAVDRCEMDHQSIPKEKMALLRSFHSFWSELDASLLSRFRLLTVLNLWYIELDNLPSSITDLRNLRYLGIRSTLVKELPKGLGKLHKLQTLDAMWSMVERLPNSIAKLKNLRHLMLFRRHAANHWDPFPGTAVGLPEEIQNLTNLQTLKHVQADEKTVKSLAKLEQMRSLQLSGMDASLTVDFSLSISRMSCLLSLEVVSRDADTVLDLEPITRPPLKLQKLALTGRLARGKLPSWTSYLTSLRQLRLCQCNIAQDSLVLLASLPKLVYLSLIGAYRERNMTFAGGSFPALRKLTLVELSKLTRIEFQKGCLEKLRDLVLDMCTELTETPHGMEDLMHLQNLELSGMPTEFVDKLQEEKGDAGYYMPANSECLQALGHSRYLRRIRRNKSKSEFMTGSSSSS